MGYFGIFYGGYGQWINALRISCSRLECGDDPTESLLGIFKYGQFWVGYFACAPSVCLGLEKNKPKTVDVFRLGHIRPFNHTRNMGDRDESIPLFKAFECKPDYLSSLFKIAF